MTGIAGAKERPEPAAAPSPAPSTASGTESGVVGFSTASDTNSTRASVTSDDGEPSLTGQYTQAFDQTQPHDEPYPNNPLQTFIQHLNRMRVNQTPIQQSLHHCKRPRPKLPVLGSRIMSLRIPVTYNWHGGLFQPRAHAQSMRYQHEARRPKR
ncbi:hypothetical protein GB937_007429 [Aspergillus fischeri]|nr:hypothetical protein GB937_007429 [Aspergillus fischeri]